MNNSMGQTIHNPHTISISDSLGRRIPGAMPVICYYGNLVTIYRFRSR